MEGTAHGELGNDSILLPKAKTLAKEIGIERLDRASHPGADPPGDRGVDRGPSYGEGVRLRVTEGSGLRSPVAGRRGAKSRAAGPERAVLQSRLSPRAPSEPCVVGPSASPHPLH